MLLHACSVLLRCRSRGLFMVTVDARRYVGPCFADLEGYAGPLNVKNGNCHLHTLKFLWRLQNLQVSGQDSEVHDCGC